jgi:gliding motility-associated lipoprotein GldH
LKKLVAFICIVTILSSCKKINIFEKRIAIPNHKWEKNFMPQFTFEKSNSKDKNIIYAIVRHTNNYPYSNIHIQLNVTTPKDSSFSITKEIPLTKNNQNKQWTNKGMDDIYEIKFPIGPFVGEIGKYRFSIENIMRDNPLPEILHIGLGIEPFE